MRNLGIVVLCAALGGCASVNYIMQEYQGVTVQEVKMSDDTYRIFDKPAMSKLMVTSSLSSAAGQGFLKGLTFGAVPTDAPKPLFEAASLQFLAESGRPGCRVVDAYILAQPQWEVKYDCTPAVATFGLEPITVPYDASFDRHEKHPTGWYHGASLTALAGLCALHGYGLAAVSEAGLNAFFTKAGQLDPATAWVPNTPREEWSGKTREEQWAAVKHMPYVTMEATF